MNLSLVPIHQDQQKGSLRLGVYPSLRGKRRPHPPFQGQELDPLIQGLLPLDFSLGDTVFRVAESEGAVDALSTDTAVIGHITKAVKTVFSAIFGKLDKTGVHNVKQLRNSEGGGYLDLTMMQIFQILHRVHISVPFHPNDSLNDDYRGFTGQMALCDGLNALHPRSVYELANKLKVAETLGWSYVSTGFAASRGFAEYVQGQRGRNARKRFKRKITGDALEDIAQAAGIQPVLTRDNVYFLLRALGEVT